MHGRRRYGCSSYPASNETLSSRKLNPWKLMASSVPATLTIVLGGRLPNKDLQLTAARTGQLGRGALGASKMHWRCRVAVGAAERLVR